MRRLKLSCLAATFAIATAWGAPAFADIYEVYPADSHTTINGKIAGLRPGDQCLFHTGRYDVRNIYVSGIRGVADNWIVIKPYGDGNVEIHGNAPTAKNTVDIDNVSYVRFEGFEITGGSDGLKFNSGTVSDHVVLENLTVHDIGATGLNSKAKELSFLTVRRCQIYNTGGHGEGMYWGSPSGPGSSILRDALIEGNWVHDTGGSQGDGIEVKKGCYRIVIQDNVVHDIANGYPGIVSYRTMRGDIADNNIIRRNVIWNAGEGIFVAEENIIENNVIFSCGYGINTHDHDEPGSVSNLIIRNNTIFNCSVVCARLGDWHLGTGRMEFVNNACLQTAETSAAISAPNGWGSATVRNNMRYGTGPSGSAASGAPGAEFVNASAKIGSIDLYPKSGGSLIDAGVNLSNEVLHDFDQTPRPEPIGGRYDIGAYEFTRADNPGWRIQPDFKPLKPDEPNASCPLFQDNE